MQETAGLRAEGRPRWRDGLLRPVLTLVVLSTALKLALLLFPGQHVSPEWVERDELHRGNIAKEIRDGPLLPLQDFHHAESSGGALVVGALAVPLFEVLGPRMIALRLVPLLFNAVSVALVFVLLRRFAGQRVAWIGGLLFALATPGYNLVSITAWGAHAEANALALGCVALLVGSREEDPRGVGRHLAAGLLAGFAAYFLYFCLIAVGVSLVYRGLRDRRFFLSRDFAAFVVGFAAGLIPWLTYNLAHEFGGLRVYDSSLLHAVRSFDDALLESFTFLTRFLPFSFFHRAYPGALGPVLDWTVYLLLLGLFAWAVWRLRGSIAAAGRSLVGQRPPRGAIEPALLFLGYALAFSIAYSMFDIGQSKFRRDDFVPTMAHQGRYANPLLPFLFMGAAVGLDAIWRSSRQGRRVAIGLLTFLLSVSVVGTLRCCEAAGLERALNRPATSTLELGRFLAWKYDQDIQRLDTIVERLESRRERERDGVLFILGQRLKASVRRRPPADAVRLAGYRASWRALRFMHERVAEPYKPYFEAPSAGEQRFARLRDRKAFWEHRLARADVEPLHGRTGSSPP